MTILELKEKLKDFKENDINEDYCNNLTLRVNAKTDDKILYFQRVYPW